MVTDNLKVTGSIPVRDSDVFLRLDLIRTCIKNYKNTANKLPHSQIYYNMELIN